MEKCEYYTLIIETKGMFGGKINENQFLSELNRLGNEGWELISSVSTNQDFGSSRNVICIFKRKIL